MRKRLLSKVFTVGFVVLVVAGCGPVSPTFPTGDFMDLDGFVVGFMDDGRSTLTNPITGEMLIENGQYSVDADTITHIEPDICPGVEGVYKWTLDGDRLLFELIEDECEPRIRALTFGLTRYTEGE